MPLKNLLVFVAFVALGTFAVMEYMKVSSLTQELNSLKTIRSAAAPTVAAKPAAPTVAAKPAAPTVAAKPPTRIICPLCKGEKEVLLGHPPNRRTQTCPVCVGVGYRMLEIPTGMAICPDCKGMGLVYFGDADRGEPVRTTNCTRCGATGLVATIK